MELDRPTPRSSGRSSRRTFGSKRELQQTYIARAKLQAEKTSVPKTFPVFSSCKQIGAAFGVGIGLYFKILQWLQIAFLVLAVCAVLYVVVINTSVFTDEAHQDDYTFGIKVYEQPSLFSFTLAAVVDTSLDNDTLQYMNTRVGDVWRGPMHKATFLTWISLVDAGAVLLLLGAITYITIQASKFVQLVDARTVEVSDFTVLVQGLPEDASPHEVGEYFACFGEVMDVVLVRDMRPVLGACAETSRLEQQRSLLTDQLRMYNSVVYAERAEKVEADLVDVLTKLESLGGGPDDFPVKAAFVTFNTETAREACMDSLPQGWWSALFRPRVDCLRQKHSLWVQSAFAPEDYIHENIPCSRWSRFLRRLLNRVVVFAIIVLCAAIITRLASLSAEESRSITWQQTQMAQAIGLAATGLQPSASASSAYQNVTTELYSLYTDTIQSAAVKLSVPASEVASTLSSNNTVAAAMDWSSYCTWAMPTACAPFFSGTFNINGFNLTYGSEMQWSNATEMLVNQRPLLAAMVACAQNSTSEPDGCVTLANELALAACLPCMCSGLSAVDSNTQSQEWVSQAKSQCDVYINHWDLQSWGMRIAVAAVIAVINYAVKVVMEYLTRFEAHWTRSEQEQTYAIVVFLAQLLNMALVLMLVNASPAADASKQRSFQDNTWLRYLVLDGQYNDFSPAWYRNVGVSIILLMILQAAGPLITVATDYMLKLAQRCWVVQCAENAPQPQYNNAFSSPEFSLAQRVADAMLNITVALMYGSGMPILYPLAVAVFAATSLTERYALARICSNSSRYCEALPKLMIGIMPWAALAHCLFGLWMHTYFKVIADDQASSVIGSGASAVGLSSGGATEDGESTGLGITLTVNTLIQRLGAANGVALLVCSVLLVLWLACKELLWRLLLPILRRCCCSWCMEWLSGPPPGNTTYESALQSRCLRGVPVYRLPHHPAYAPMFAGKLHKAMWLGAQGHWRYTRVVSDSGHPGQLLVSRELLTEVTAAEVSAAAAAGKLPACLASIAARLATYPNAKNKGRWSLMQGAGDVRSSADMGFIGIGTGQVQLLGASSSGPTPTAMHTGAQTPSAVQATWPNRMVHIDVMADGQPKTATQHVQVLPPALAGVNRQAQVPSSGIAMSYPPPASFASAGNMVTTATAQQQALLRQPQLSAGSSSSSPSYHPLHGAVLWGTAPEVAHASGSVAAAGLGLGAVQLVEVPSGTAGHQYEDQADAVCGTLHQTG